VGAILSGWINVRLFRQPEGGTVMKNHRVILSTVSLVFFFGVLTPHFAQNTPEKPDLERRALAMGLVRSIGTVESEYHDKNGSYATWQNLLSSHPQYFEKFLTMHGLRQANLHFADAPEILPGWNLRLRVHADGQGFDLMLQDPATKQVLQDPTTKQVPYAIFLNEDAIIWEATALQ
jgi:hypothetical protein